MRRFLLFTSLCCLLTVSGAPAADAQLEAELQRIIDDFLAANEVAPGVCATAICPSLDLDWDGAAGTVDRDSAEPLTAEHTLRIASNTKTYTATAILRLVEEGRLGLDDPLSRHLPADQRELLAGDGYDLDAITLRHVLSHTSGLFEHPADPRFEEAILADPQRVWRAEEVIRLCVEWGDPVGDAGEKYSYSDTGYVILGCIIERVTGLSLGVAVHELLDYGELGLDATWWEIMEQRPATAGARAHQYYGDEDTSDWHPSLDLYGGGGIISDVADMARFLRLLLGGEVLRHEQTLSAMCGSGTASYRLGLMCMELGGHVTWGHQGFWNTFAFHVPSLDLTVAGGILNHHAANGRHLADELVAAVAVAVQARDAGE